MTEVFEVVNSWPVLIQGALGSGLFWLVLKISQKLVSYLGSSLGRIFRNIRKTELINERIRLRAAVAESGEKSKYSYILMYRASRPFLKAIMWLVLGLMLGQTMQVLSIVGYIGSLFYLFKAFEIVKAIHAPENPEQRLKELAEQLQGLKDVEE